MGWIQLRAAEIQVSLSASNYLAQDIGRRFEAAIISTATHNRNLREDPVETLSRTALFHAPWLDYSCPTLFLSTLGINGELRHDGEPTGLQDVSVELSILMSCWLTLEALSREGRLLTISQPYTCIVCAG
jgi:hypothetical protein